MIKKGNDGTGEYAQVPSFPFIRDILYYSFI